MAISRFSFQHFLIRFVAALVLVLVTYNPVSPYSYFEWAIAPLIGMQEGSPFSVLKAFIGLVILVGWVIFGRASTRSLGTLGLLLAAAFFLLLFWMLFDQGWLSLDNPNVVSWLILISVAGIMALGMSWSHIRRRMSGQLDVDETDDSLE